MKLSILVLTTFTTALMAGLFFTWHVSITPGLARLSDKEYISVMQTINRAIQNLAFLCCFFGTALLLPITTYMNYGQPNPLRFWLLLTASAVYLIGVLGVTIFGNIPLNESLDSFNLSSASAPEVDAKRSQFETPWNNLNNVRTVASLLSLVLIIIVWASGSSIHSD